MRGNMSGFVKPVLLIILVVALVITLAFVVAGSMGGNKTLGDAVDFTATDVDGKSFTLSQNYASGAALVFFDLSQGDGKALLTNLAAANKGTSVQTVLIAIGEPQEIKKHLAENKLTADVVIADPKAEIAALYNVTTCPVTYFIDADGQVRAVSLSNLTPSAAQKYISYIQN